MRTIVFDQSYFSIEDIVDVSQTSANVALSNNNQFRFMITRGANFIDKLLQEEGVIYGVTTGFGDSCNVTVPQELVAELPHHLYTYHGCGLGEYFNPEQTRAIMATRLVSLCKGYSGISLNLLEQILLLLQRDILPLIPSEGSVGASGDLTPLSYLAAVLCGEREVLYENNNFLAAEIFAKLNIHPLRLRPKEGLGIMNGTAVMTALSCLIYKRAEYVAQLSTRITAMGSVALEGNAHHFDEVLFSVKPHAGQQQIAAWLRQDLLSDQSPRNEKRLQDRYSIRCAPHIIGVLQDALPWFRKIIENELNSANDNPIIDSENEKVLHGGHFYGGHIAFVMDSLKNIIANIADLLDRQMALLVDVKYNHGLPANLSGANNSINHGLKALQISVSAWTAEALKLTMPASVFSRSTECHNQDKVSMGTIAARDCWRVLELTEQVIAALLITVRQGLELRGAKLTESLKNMQELLSQDILFIKQDRRLEPDLKLLLERIRKRAWKLYDQN